MATVVATIRAGDIGPHVGRLRGQHSQMETHPRGGSAGGSGASEKNVAHPKCSIKRRPVGTMLRGLVVFFLAELMHTANTKRFKDFARSWTAVPDRDRFFIRRPPQSTLR